MFGIFGELMKNEQVRLDRAVDMALPTGSFAAPMAAWYARKMGLPIGNILCGCNENSAVWELICRGSLETSVTVVKTSTPKGDYAMPPELERLIHGTLGTEEVMRYQWCCAEGEMYVLPEEKQALLNEGMYAAVVSNARVDRVIQSAYSTDEYILDPYSALAYGALSDYRSQIGNLRTSLIYMEDCPLQNAQTVAECLSISLKDSEQRTPERKRR
jgi:threonine synthase